MILYKNGDRCPCCGTVLEGRSDEWLLGFSEMVNFLRLPEWPALADRFELPALTEEAAPQLPAATAPLAQGSREKGDGGDGT